MWTWMGNLCVCVSMIFVSPFRAGYGNNTDKVVIKTISKSINCLTCFWKEEEISIMFRSRNVWLNIKITFEIMLLIDFLWTRINISRLRRQKNMFLRFRNQFINHVSVFDSFLKMFLVFHKEHVSYKIITFLMVCKEHV